LTELVGALIPGVLFVLLLIVKHVPEATAAIGTTVIGYRTKIACGLLISFVIGRLFYIPVSLLQTRLLLLGAENLQLIDDKKQGSFIQKLTKEGGQLFLSPMVSGLLRGASTWEHLHVAQSEVAFRLSTGFAFVVASLIPGDGRMRVAELLAGLFFVGFGVRQGREMRGLVLVLLGSSAADGFLKLSNQHQQLVLTIAKTLLSTQPQGTQPPSVAKEPDKGQPLQPQTPTAPAGTVPILHPNDANPPVDDSRARQR
jgi:hypothetical protein